MLKTKSYSEHNGSSSPTRGPNDKYLEQRGLKTLNSSIFQDEADQFSLGRAKGAELWLDRKKGINDDDSCADALFF